MRFIVCIAIIFAISLGFHAQIKKYRSVIYVITAIMAAFASFYSFAGTPAWFRNTILYVFQRGSLSAAFFTVVMYATLFKNGSLIKKRLMSIRAELSIMGCIIAIGHNTAMGRIYFRMLLTNPGQLTTLQLVASVISILLIAMMIPLCVTSFTAVRRKMKAGNWKKLQRLAYPFYILIYVHVMVITMPYVMAGHVQYMLNFAIYSTVFTFYGMLRVLKAKRDYDARRIRTKNNEEGVLLKNETFLID